MQAARSGGHVVALFVPTAGGVVVPEPPVAAAQVVAGEDRHDDHALHRRRQVATHHRRQLVGLALEAERRALDLLVVLELQLEQRIISIAGPAVPAMATPLWRSAWTTFSIVRCEIRLPDGGATIAGHDDAVVVAQRDARGGVRHAESSRTSAEPTGRHGRRRVVTDSTKQIGEVRSRVVTDGRRTASTRITARPSGRTT